MRNSGRFVFFAFAGWIITSAAQGTDRQDRNGIGSRVLELTPLSEIQVQAWAAGAEDAAAIADGRLFIPLGYRGLAIYDITNPSQPVPVAHVEYETLEGQEVLLPLSGTVRLSKLPRSRRLQCSTSAFHNNL